MANEMDEPKMSSQPEKKKKKPNKVARARGKRSRRKGIGYERSTAEWYRQYGFDARRGLQSRDGDVSDVIVGKGKRDYDWWIECKSYQRMGGVHKAYAQARVAESTVEHVNFIIVHTHENEGEHLVTMQRDQFATLVGWVRENTGKLEN